MSRCVGSTGTGGPGPLSVDDRISTIESADLAATTAELELEMLSYRAALATTSRVMQPSLLDFLR